MARSATGGLLRTAHLISLLQDAGVDRSSVIRVTGPSALSALLWLRRNGYEQVGYVRPGGGGPHEADPDAIIVAHTCDEIDLKRLLAVGRQVRPGGVFIFQVRTGAESSELGVDWLLEAAGFHIEHRHDGERRALVIARRRSLALRQAA